MENFSISNTLQDQSNDISTYGLCSNNSRLEYPMDVVAYVIIAVSLPVTLVAIYAVYSLVQKDNVTPIYVINLLISDVIQICYMIVSVAVNHSSKTFEVFYYIYHFGVTASVCFMVCIALERYLAIGCPLWYRFRRTIKITLGVCVLVWAFSLIYILSVYFCYSSALCRDPDIVFDIFFLVPFPLLIFFLGGTLKALSRGPRIPSDEKRRFVALQVLVVLIYTLLFLPAIIWSLADKATAKNLLSDLSSTFIQLSPLADSFLYVFLRKGVADKHLVSLCCCKMDNKDTNTTPA